MLERREKENKRENILQRNKKTNNQPVILSEEKRRAFFAVEVLPSEERGKTEERMRRRDMATSLGGFSRGM